MTEAEWLSCGDPDAMLVFLQDKGLDRKLRLFSCACCRRVWHLLGKGASRTAVETAERFADGLVGEVELEAARRAALAAADVYPEEAAAAAATPDPAWVSWAAEAASYDAADPVAEPPAQA